MFEDKKTLIVVYKDELLMNQLKKMVETHDDNEQDTVGTRDDSINIISWTEKVWLANKKAGNLQGKILFLGDIKGTDKLTPIVDVKFDEYGVKFGWAGNQAVVFADPKILAHREDYDSFLEKLSELPIPEFLKEAKKNIAIAEKVKTKEAPEAFHAAKRTLSLKVDTALNQMASKSEELFRNKSLMKKQMLFYGVINLYYNGLEIFMNL